jgi:hypothetical protein
MTTIEADPPKGDGRLVPHERRFRLLLVPLALLYAGFVVATLGGAPESVITLVFGVVMIPAPFVAWLTYAKAPVGVRRLWLLLAGAATLWFAGSLIWYILYFAAGSELPDTPAPSDAIFAAARLTVITAIVVAMRSMVSFRLALLDASVIVAAGTALGAAFVADGLRDAVDTPSLFLLYSPLLGTVTLMLIVSAALGSSAGLPLSTALVGAGQALLTVGSMLYTQQAIEGGFADARWPDMLYTGGAVISYLAAATILFRVDRPVRLFRVQIPHHPGGSVPVLLLSLAALAVALGVTSYGLLTETRALSLVGVVAAVSIGVAMALRARNSIRTAENAYARLDRALVDIERARDEFALANEELGRANARVRAMQIAQAELLNLADERTHGRMRELIEETGSDLADLLQEELERARRR